MGSSYCSQCGTALREGDKFCSQCGYSTLGDSAPILVQQDGGQPLSGPNRINFWQSATESHFEAAFTDNTATQLADVVQTLVGSKIIRPIVRIPLVADGLRGDVGEEFKQREDSVESTLEPVPTLDSPDFPPAHDSQGEGAVDGTVFTIAQVFTTAHGEIRLRQLELKAKTPTEYIKRAVRLFLHYMQQQEDAVAVSKSNVYDFLRAMSLKPTNYRPVISRDTAIDKGKDTLKLNQLGEQPVQRYLGDLANPELDDGWYPGKEERASTSRKKVARRRRNESDDTEALDLTEWKPEIRQLRETIRSHHQDVVQWQTSNTVLLGLYAVRKQYGDDHEISYRSLTDFLYSAFELSVKEDSIRRALDRLRDSDKKYINPGRNRGYRISPSGIQYVDNELLHSLNQTEPQLDLFSTAPDSEAAL